MKLITFNFNTAGGLMCDLLNGIQSPIVKGEVKSPHHQTFKMRSDNGLHWTQQKLDYIINDINQSSIDYWIDISKKNQSSDMWFGAHFPVTKVPNIDDFEKIINITTDSMESKLYTLIRTYYLNILKGRGHFRDSGEIEPLLIKDKYDKNYYTFKDIDIKNNAKETIDDPNMLDIMTLATSILKDSSFTYFDHPNVINLEFEDIVNGSFITDNNLSIKHFDFWKQHNDRLYNPEPEIVNFFTQQLLQ